MTDSLLAWTLKASLLLLAGFAVTGSMRRHSAAARHFVWTLTLAAVLVLPIVGAVLPAWRVRSVPAALFPPARPQVTSPSGATGAVEGPAVTLQFRAAERRSEPLPPQSERFDLKAAAPRIDWVALAPLIWALGAAIVLLRLGVGLAGVWRLARRATMMTDAHWLHRAHAIAQALGMARGVTLLKGDRGSVPMTWGVLQPVVWLPADADSWDDERRTVVLAHELAHVRRRDALTQWIAHLALLLHWFNPLAWMALKRFRDERERACDDAVLTLGTRATTYADHLLDIVRSHGAAGGPVPALAMARRSQFEGRLLAILDGASPRRGLGARAAISAGALALTALLPVAAIRGAADEPSAPAPVDASADSAWIETVSPNFDPAAGVGAEPAGLAATTQRAQGRDTLIRALRSSGADTTLRLIIASAAGMTSDGDRSDVLRAVLRHPKLDAGDVAAVLRATLPMTADGERKDVLAAAIPVMNFDDAAHRSAFFAAMARFTSNGDRKDVLAAALEVAPLGDPAIRKAFAEATGGMTSDGDRGDLLVTLLERGRLEPAVLTDIIRSIASMTSDGAKASVLVAAVDHQQLDDDARAAYMEVVGTMTSDGSRSEALRALLPDGAETPVAGESASRADRPRRVERPLAVASADSRVVNGTRRWTTSLRLDGTHDGRPNYEVTIDAVRAIVTADAQRLVGLEPGGSLVIEHTVHPGGEDPTVERRTTRTLRLRRTGDRLSREYRVNGVAREWDADGKAWLDRVVARWAGGKTN